MLLIVTVAVMYTQLLLKIPRVSDRALMAGNAQGDEIEAHIDSGASRHFTSDARLFASWDDGVPNIIFDTAAGVPITSRVVDTLKFLAMNV